MHTEAKAAGSASNLGARAALQHALAVLAPLATLVLLVSYVTRHEFAVDFQHTYWIAGQRVVHGLDPYVATHGQVTQGVAFVYPALAGLLFAPFGLIAQGTSAAIYTALSFAALFATLRVLSVRDWRVYAMALLWFPVINAWQSANVTLLLGLLIALAWRYRSRPVLTALLTAFAVSLKPFVWPLGLWLIATRRYRAAAWAVGWGLVLNLVAWQILGFRDIGQFLHLSSAVTSALFRTGYAVIAICVRLGASRGVGTAVMVLVSAGLVLTCLWLGRRHREESAFTIAVALMLAASPLVWNHYFALLIVPAAVCRRRLSAEWLIPLALWVCPSMHVAEWQALVAAAVTAVFTYRLTSTPLAAGQRGWEQTGPATPLEAARPA